MQNNVAQEIVRSPLRIKLSKLSKEQENPEGPNELENTHQEIMAQTPPINDQTPRFVKCVSHDVENGNIREYTWDKEKIFVHECLHDDVLMLQNVFEGKIISPLVYPLVFDWKSSQKEICLRSIQFYREVQDDNSLYQSLSPDEKGYFLIGLRDLFIAACRGMLSQEEKKMLVNIVNLIDPRDNNIVYKTINNIDVSPYPTASHKMVRFLEEEKSGEDSNVLDECFVRNELGLLVGFVDPRDLSFHNFENIMNLDSLFNVGEDFPITNFQKHGDNEVYTFDLEDKRGLLLSLDKCGLYTQPLNKMSRGGERFIFASRVFGNNLTNSLQKHVSDKTVINSHFQFVNYVFRYNKFKPGDKKFTSHFDTSYHDPARKHYSKYTLLLYLTPGTADPVLSVDNGKVKIDSIAANNGCMKGVIFDQKYEHEGKSFIDSDKIFLRSELVYSYSNEELGFNGDISKKFNIACYMTKQSVFNPELEKYSSDCFNQAAQARIDFAKVKLTEDVLIYKNYRGVPFITNGYDYWFLKKTNLKIAGIVTVLDYFGGKYAGLEMKDFAPGVVCYIADVKDVFKHLKSYVCPNSEEEKNDMEKQENTTTEEDNNNDIIESLKCDFGSQFDRSKIDIAKVRAAIYYGGREPYYGFEDEEDDEEKGEDEEEEEDEEDDDDSGEEDEDNEYACSFCGLEHPTRGDVQEYLDSKNQRWESFYYKKDQFAIFIFNKEVKIEKSKIKINRDSIIFKEKIPTVNFANCEYNLEDESADFLFETEKINLKAYANIPPIFYKAYNEGYHLKIELFNNGFVREECFKFKKHSLKEKYFKKEKTRK